MLDMEPLDVPFFRWTTLLSEEEEEEGGNVRSLIPRSRRKRAAQCSVIELQRYTRVFFLALLGVRQRVDAVVGTRVGCRVTCVHPWHAQCWPYIGFHTCP
jgi:hypothetical protein